MIDAVETQSRAKIDVDVVREYAEVVDQLPPVRLVKEGDKPRYWIEDGYHRALAAKEAGRKSVRAIVRIGSRDDAVLAACAANIGHGLRRSPDDKRRAVRMCFEHPTAREWSDRQIADHCRVDHKTVARVREELRPVQLGNSPVDAPRLGRDGKTRNLPQPKVNVEVTDNGSAQETTIVKPAESAPTNGQPSVDLRPHQVEQVEETRKDLTDPPSTVTDATPSRAESDQDVDETEDAESEGEETTSEAVEGTESETTSEPESSPEPERPPGVPEGAAWKEEVVNPDGMTAADFDEPANVQQLPESMSDEVLLDRLPALAKVSGRLRLYLRGELASGPRQGSDEGESLRGGESFGSCSGLRSMIPFPDPSADQFQLLGKVHVADDHL